MAYRFSGSPSIKDRLTSARHDLALVRGVLQGKAAGVEGVLSDDVHDWAESLLVAAERVSEELFWISEQPDVILAAPAPDHDEVNGVSGEHQHDAVDAVRLSAALAYLRARPELGGAR